MSVYTCYYFQQTGHLHVIANYMSPFFCLNKVFWIEIRLTETVVITLQLNNENWHLKPVFSIYTIKHFYVSPTAQILTWKTFFVKQGDGC